MPKDAVPLDGLSRALVIKLRHHGDVLLAAPVLSTLKSHAPRLEIDALVYEDTAPMLEGHPALARLHAVGRGWRDLGSWARLGAERRLYADLRGRNFDLIVHLSEQPRGAWLARWLGARYSVAPRMPERGEFWQKSFTHLYPLLNNGRRHQVELNLDALRRIGIQPGNEDRRVVFEPGADANARVEALLAEHGLVAGSYVHVHPASRWRFKCWPAEKNAELITRLAIEERRVVLTAAPEEGELGFIGEILKRTQAPVVNLAGKLSVRELGALAARAGVFVGVDSMPMHLASAMGTPVVAIFGPSGDIEWGPWRGNFRVVSSSHSCRPCGMDGCGGGKVSECLMLLPVNAVHEAVRELLPAA
jgi:heptosyltransferase III